MPGKRLAIALVSFAACCAAVPAVAAAPPAELSARQLAGLRIVTGFHGRAVPDQLRQMISAGDVAGVVLFSENVGGAADVQALTRQLQEIPRPAAVDAPLLVMSDQEGGLVRRLPGKPRVSAQVAGTKGSAFASKLGSQTGGSMNAMGVNVDLAPVLDVGRSGRAIDSEHRAWGRSAAAVKRTAIPFALGLQSAGVAATAKHFPGHGDTGVSITDALGTASGRAFGGTAKLALAATGAGTDMLLFSDIGQAAAAGGALRASLDAGAPRAQFEASAQRIVDLRNSFVR
jgi:beta-glucosidase-like glycosyl hydrolase